MAEQEQAAKDVVQEEVGDEEEEDNPDYKPPAPKALDEIVNQDADDESLVKYKETLLGGLGNAIVDANNENRVILQKLALVVEGRDEVFIDLTKPLEEIKKETFTLKDGCKYQIKIYFYVQREIVSGLVYKHVVYRKGIRVDRMSQMMGSYGPKTDMQSFLTQVEDAPSGMLARGNYKVKSFFLDDDKNEYFSCEWHLAVQKDW